MVFWHLLPGHAARSARSAIAWMLACSVLCLALLPATARSDSACPGPLPEPPAGDALCRVVAGAGDGLLLQGMVLQDSGALDNGQVLVDGDGIVACVGCDCSGNAAASTATRIECPGAAISPGLIDAMNRLTFAQNFHYAPPDPDVRYMHRHQWRIGLDGLPKITASSGASVDQVRWAELRSVLAGVTASTSSGRAVGFLRNLTHFTDAGALQQQRVDPETFPLGDSNGTIRTDSCDYPDLPAPAVDQRRTQLVAEGLDCRARNEFLCLSGQQAGAVDAIPDSSIEHGLALTTQDLALLRDVGGSLTWHPRTQVSVYGASAPVLEALALGLPVAIGTNWTRTGSMHLGRELACARSLDQAQFDGRIGDRTLWRMATANGAIAAGMQDAIGVLQPGAVGDIIVVDRHGGDGYTAVVTAAATDLELVLRGGIPLAGEAALMEALGSGAPDCDLMDVCGVQRRVCVGRETAGAHSLASLTASIGSSSPPLVFCGVPDDEPTCTPARSAPFAYTGKPVPGDADGDGIGDATDNCPTVFNPLRQVDFPPELQDATCPLNAATDPQGFSQADTDGDGAGDTCDRCPLDADDTCGDALVFRNGFEALPE